MRFGKCFPVSASNPMQLHLDEPGNFLSNLGQFTALVSLGKRNFNIELAVISC